MRHGRDLCRRIRAGRRGGRNRPADDDDLDVVVGLEAVEELAEEIPELAEGEEQPVAEERGQRRRVPQPPHHLASLVRCPAPRSRELYVGLSLRIGLEEAMRWS